MIAPEDRWRVELVSAAARWAQNLLVEVQGNHGKWLPTEAREHLHSAIRHLSEIPHALPEQDRRLPSRAAVAHAEQMANAERKAVRRGR